MAPAAAPAPTPPTAPRWPVRVGGAGAGTRVGIDGSTKETKKCTSQLTTNIIYFSAVYVPQPPYEYNHFPFAEGEQK